MKLHDLTTSQRAVLDALATDLEHGRNRAALIEMLCKNNLYTMPAGTVGSCLNRLEAYGFVDRPESAGGAWRINGDGMGLLAGTTADDPDPTPVGAVCEPPLPNAEPPPASPLPWDVEQALWKTKVQLSGKTGVPANALFVYHAILMDLPEPLRRELHAITTLLERL